MTGFIGDGIKTSGPSLNVINVLRNILENNDNSEVYIPYDYVRETKRRSKDPNLHYQPRESGNSVRVVNLVSNSERFNFSLTAKIDVLITTGNSLSVKQVYRNYTVIRDGELAISRLYIKIGSEEQYKILHSAKLLFFEDGQYVDDDMEYSRDAVYTLDLSKLPTVSCNWAQPNNIGLVDLLIIEDSIKTKISNIKRRIKYLNSIGIYRNITFDEINTYTEKREYLDDSEEDTSREKREVKCVVYKLKNYKPENQEDLWAEELDIDKLHKIQKELNSELRMVRLRIRSIVFAVETVKGTGGIQWSERYTSPRSTKIMCDSEARTKDDRVYTIVREEYYKSI